MAANVDISDDFRWIVFPIAGKSMKNDKGFKQIFRLKGYELAHRTFGFITINLSAKSTFKIDY
jgi:hypothetical protein